MKSEIKNILLLKHYGIGIGDVVRSTASWRSIKEQIPGVRVHIFFWPHKTPSAAEYIMYHSEYLDSVHIIQRDQVKRWWGRYTPLRSFKKAFELLRQVAELEQVDLVIDQELHGIDNAILSVWFRLKKIKTIGISQYPLKCLFYSFCSDNDRVYAKKNKTSYPLDYTDKDYVALDCLGIWRDGQKISISPRPIGSDVAVWLGVASMLVGINIGCGGDVEVAKRPAISLYVNIINSLIRRYDCDMILTGTAEESWLNEGILKSLSDVARPRVKNLAGKTNMEDLLGVITSCKCFISSDSGPFHLAVALEVPAIGLFNWPNPACYHVNSITENIVLGSVDDLSNVLSAFERIVTVAV